MFSPNFKNSLFFRQIRPSNALIWAGALVFMAAEATAQTTTVQGPTVFLEAPREWRQPLVRAERAIEEKRYGDAVQELSRILVPSETDDLFEYSNQDYFVLKAGETPVSLRSEAQRLLGSLPAKGRAEFELQHGPEARRLLKEAVSEGDIEKLTEITGKFFHTSAGYEATIILGRYHLDRGRALAGALCFRRVLDTPSAAGQFEPELSLLLATSWLFAGQQEKTRETLVNLKRRKYKLDGVDFFDDDQKAVAWLESLVGNPPKRDESKSKEWLLFRGNVARNGATEGGLPLKNLRWRVPTANDPVDEESVGTENKRFRDAKLAALPSIHPLAVGGYVLMRSPNKLLAVDFDSGKRVWEFPWAGEPTDGANLQDEALSIRGQQGSRREQELKQRLWEDAPYGQMSSDGESVFLLDELGFASSNRYVRMMRGGIGISSQRSHNKLVALSLARQGALIWKVGGKENDGENDEPQLGGAFFLGAPVPIMGHLYALAEIKNEIRLVVLDRHTGQLQWSQQIAQVEDGAVQMDKSRRLAGASPSFSDGVLVCPTSTGAIVAVDITTRTLMWGFQYKRVIARTHGFGRVAEDNRTVGARWADSTLTIADGRVIATPVESDEIFCLDLLTGKSLWPAKKRSDMLYVACVHADQAIVVGTDNVRAINGDDGKQAWVFELNASARPSGRGYFSNGFYYLPTTDAKVIKIDLNTGESAGASDSEGVLGNLICYRGEVISHGVDWLSTYHQDRSLRLSVIKRLRDNPDDVGALADHGALLLQDGKPAEAIPVVRRAYQLQSSDTHRALLIRALLAALRQDFMAHETAARELEPLIDQPDQKAEFLRLKAVALARQGRSQAAFQTFLLMADYKNGEAGKSPALARIDAELQVRNDRWIRGQLAKLFATASESDRLAMSQELVPNLQAAQKSSDSKAIRQALRFFGFHPESDSLRLALARQQIANQDFLESQLLLSRLSRVEDDGVRAPSSALLARVLDQAGQHQEAARQYLAVAKQWPDTVCLDGKTGRELVESLAPDSPLQHWLVDAVWPTGRIKVNETGETVGRSNSQRMYPIALRQSRGGFLEGATLHFAHPEVALVVRNPDGSERARVSLKGASQRLSTTNMSILHAKVNGHMVLLTLGFEIVAVDLLRAQEQPEEAILWRHDLTKAMADVAAARTTSTRVAVEHIRHPWGANTSYAVDAYKRLIGPTGSLSDDGICYIQQRELICVNALTGEKQWIRDRLEPGSDVFGDDQLVFVAGPKAEEAFVFNAIDGSLLGQRPVADFEHRLATSGRRVLSWKELGGKLLLTLDDVWSKDNLFRREFSAGSKGFLIQGEEMAVFQPTGELAILSLKTGDLSLEAKLDPEPRLTGLAVLRSATQYIVAVNRPITMTDPAVTIATSPGGDHSTMIHGKVFALDRATGERQWDKPAIIDQFSMPLDQSPEVPVLTFLRHMTPTSRSGPRRLQTSLLCIDKRTGRTIVAKDDIRSHTYNYGLQAKVQEQTVDLRLPGKSFQFKFTDEKEADDANPPRNSAEGAKND